MSAAARKLVVLGAGGTGGHMFPAQALARALLARGREVVLITDERGAGFGPELPQVETYRIKAGGIAGGGLLRKLTSLWSLGLGTLQAGGLLKRLQPDCVVGFGGYASVPSVFAASRRGLRILLHEQNAVMGRANKLMAGRATTIATSFPAVQGLAPALQERTVLTGNPVRAAVAALGSRPYALPGPNDGLRLLVTGGSQGAAVFDNLIPEAVSRLPETLCRRLHVTQQVRGRDLEDVRADYTACGVETDLKAFFDDLPERLAASHLVICRAGASTIAELCAAGRPAILVPYPFATDDHQSANAAALETAGGGWLMPQSSLDAAGLAERLAVVLDSPSELARAAGAARALAKLEAAEHLADLVCSETGRNGGTDHDERERAA